MVEVLPESVTPAAPNESYELPERIIDVHNHGKADSDGSDLVELMDAHNIDWTVVLGLPADSRANNQAVL
ncbi:hypothetical protein LCGC14_2350130, partial [marine sediment metagenome]